MNGQKEITKLEKTDYEAFENFLIAKYERLIGAMKARSYPYVMNIDPCNICQLRCPACYTGITNDALKKKLIKGPYRKLERLPSGILDSVLSECGKVLFYCYFYNWGEPLLNENLSDYIRRAKAFDIYTKVDSNLSLKCSEAMLERLLLSGLDELSASIDGFCQQTYEKYRVGGRFDLVLENLEKLIAIRNRLGCNTKIVWKFLVYSFNEHEAEAIAAFCQERRIEFLPADPIILNDKPEWVPAYRREGKPNPYIARQARPNSATPAGQVPLYPGRPEGLSCGWHYSYTTINADGSVLPCCGLFSRKFDFGYVTAERGSFGSVWNNANFETVRRDFPGGKETKASGPTIACTQCRRPAAYRDHFTMLDREIIARYWSFAEGSRVRELDKFYSLLQKSPSEFVAAYAPRYDGPSPNPAQADCRPSVPGA